MTPLGACEPEGVEPQMNTSTVPSQSDENNGTKRRVAKRITQVVVVNLIMVLILFLSAGDLLWVWAWVYLGVGFAILAANSRVMPPDLIAERGEPRDNVKKWDRVVTSLAGIPTLGTYVVAGLDYRFGWSPPLDLAIHLAGLALFILGQALFTWAMVSNRFFSTVVRLQMDRDHTVATGGPYRYVRHPGYSGYIVFSLGMSLLFGSLWALVPVGATFVLMIIRTILEDRTLREELPGYGGYAATVRYRLVPGVW